MKTSPASSLASSLALISLSLALCACDSGDKKEGAAPVLPPKKEKPPVTTDAAPANPTPPESAEPAKDMNAPAAPADASGASFVKSPTGEKLDAGVIALQQAVGNFRMKNAMSGMKGGSLMGGPSNPNIKQTTPKAAASTLTSLDQLVTGGFIKSIPEAPAGKKYVLDVKAMKVSLENK